MLTEEEWLTITAMIDEDPEDSLLGGLLEAKIWDSTHDLMRVKFLTQRLEIGKYKWYAGVGGYLLLIERIDRRIIELEPWLAVKSKQSLATGLWEQFSNLGQNVYPSVTDSTKTYIIQKGPSHDHSAGTGQP